MNWDAKAIILVVITVINCIILFTMKFNDLIHIEKDVSELKRDMKCYIKKLYSLAQRVAKIEGKISKK